MGVCHECRRYYCVCHRCECEGQCADGFETVRREERVAVLERVAQLIRDLRTGCGASYEIARDGNEQRAESDLGGVRALNLLEQLLGDRFEDDWPEENATP